eukprot:scaffold2113_cov233-Pinguiococcus_pyrenoidosus.AAC.13
MKSGGNVLVAGAAKTGDVVRHLAAEVGVDVDKKGSQVLDNVSYDAKLGAVVSYGASPLLHVLHSAAGPETPVRFQGIGHSIDASNHLAVKILEGNPTSFSAKPGEATGEKPESIGPDTLLASGLQGHNNARFVFCGSLPLFSDAFHNEDFALQMAKWAFAENGIIRFANVTHSRVDGSPPELLLKQKEKPDLPKSLFPDPEITRNSLVYRIKDMLYYEVTINTWDGDAQAWAPFHAEDVQLEFVMLDPYIRTTLTSDGEAHKPPSGRPPNDHVSGDGKFSTSFMAPDKYGIFKFKLLYRRPGLSTLHVEKVRPPVDEIWEEGERRSSRALLVVSVRPFKHNEYERYITSAYPYYTAAFVLMAAVTVFSFLFLFTEDKTVLSKTHRD